METDLGDISFAAAFDDACAILQTIVNTARNYGNCLTDNIYCTDYIARNSIIRGLCNAYYGHVNCYNYFEPETAAISERAAVLDTTAKENIAALPLPIKDFLTKIETYNAETDGDEILNNIAVADVVVAADEADADYTYGARLATAAMDVYAGICNPDDFDRGDIYIGLRLAAIKLQEFINDAVTEFVLSICTSDITPAQRACIDPAAKLLEMSAAAEKAKVLLFGFTGIDYRESGTLWYDNDIKATQAVDIINKAVDVKSENTEALLGELDAAIREIPGAFPEQTNDNIRKALTTLRKLSKELGNAMKE